MLSQTERERETATQRARAISGRKMNGKLEQYREHTVGVCVCVCVTGR